MNSTDLTDWWHSLHLLWFVTKCPVFLSLIICPHTQHSHANNFCFPFHPHRNWERPSISIVCVHVTVHVCSPVHQCVKARNSHQMSSSIALHLSLWRQDLSLNQELPLHLHWLSYKPLRSFLSLPSGTVKSGASHAQLWYGCLASKPGSQSNKHFTLWASPNPFQGCIMHTLCSLVAT